MTKFSNLLKIGPFIRYISYILQNFSGLMKKVLLNFELGASSLNISYALYVLVYTGAFDWCSVENNRCLSQLLYGH